MAPVHENVFTVVVADGRLALLFKGELIAKFRQDDTIHTVNEYIVQYGCLAEYRRRANILAVSTKESLSWDETMRVVEYNVDIEIPNEEAID